MTPQFVSCGLSLLAVGCDEALSVYADADKLQQILLNLLTNASKFTLPGGSVSISCTAEADSAAIAVSDTGIGIPPDKLAGVFDPFIQVDTRLTRTAEGVGLGLAISRDLANAMGGELTAMSVVGTGSTFTLRLPRWAP